MVHCWPTASIAIRYRWGAAKVGPADPWPGRDFLLKVFGSPKVRWRPRDGGPGYWEGVKGPSSAAAGVNVFFIVDYRAIA